MHHFLDSMAVDKEEDNKDKGNQMASPKPPLHEHNFYTTNLFRLRGSCIGKCTIHWINTL